MGAQWSKGSERHPPSAGPPTGASSFVPQDVAFSKADCSKQEKQVVHERGSRTQGWGKGGGGGSKSALLSNCRLFNLVPVRIKQCEQV